jgi:Protein of unknown function (DUF3306)
MTDFLSRWARRKQATQAAGRAQCPPDADSPVAPVQAAGSGAPQSGDTSDTSPNTPERWTPEFDPGSLPAIQSITAETDIRAFLDAGVPTELTRAALRRVWTSDPKIRNFVGLADYDWDFNAPGSMAGFGPLEGVDALRAQMTRRLVPDRTEDEAAEKSDRDLGAKHEVGTSDDLAQARPEQSTQVTTEDAASQKNDPSREGDDSAPLEHEYTAVQQQSEKSEDVQSIARRRHGKALPET